MGRSAKWYMTTWEEERRELFDHFNVACLLVDTLVWCFANLYKSDNNYQSLLCILVNQENQRRRENYLTISMLHVYLWARWYDVLLTYINQTTIIKSVLCILVNQENHALFLTSWGILGHERWGTSFLFLTKSNSARSTSGAAACENCLLEWWGQCSQPLPSSKLFQYKE